MGLEDRAALVTGGSRRMGEAIAVALARAGADVAITYRTRVAEARSVVRKVEALGRSASAVRADLARPADCLRAVDSAAKAFGRLDILVNNAGPWVVKPVADTTLADWRAVLDANLTATFLCSKRAVPVMRRRNWGRIVNLGTAGAYRAHGSARMAAYYAAKAGVVAFSKALAREVGRDGITVNVVAPGVMGEPAPGRELRPGYAGTAVGRRGTWSDVAAAVLFLVSDEAAFVTGDVLNVTGGWLL